MNRISLHAEPGVVLTWDEFRAARAPFGIALDGYVSGPTRFSSEGPYANFNHHEGVDRMSTRAACAQAYFSITLGLFDTFQRDGKPHAHIYVNDADQDVCLAYWLLTHPEIAADVHWDDPIAMLIVMEDFVDASAGAYPFDETSIPKLEKQAWVFEPYTEARADGKLQSMSGPEMEKLIEEVCDRISLFAASKGGTTALDTRHKVIGGGPGWKMVIETGIYARTALYSAGAKVFVGVRPRKDGNYTYVIGKMSPFIPFPIEAVYQALNSVESIHSPADCWGGSDTIGGSPRKSGSGLPPEEVEKIINRILS